MSQSVLNTATITYNGETLPPTCPVLTEVEQRLSITKSAVTESGTFTDNSTDNVMTEGNTIRYQFHLVNYSSVDFTNVVFIDTITLPSGVVATDLTFLAPPDSSYANESVLPEVKFTLPDIPAESSLDIFYTIELDDSIPAESSFSNIASVAYVQNDVSETATSNEVTVIYNNTSTTVTAAKTGPSSVFCGEDYDYVLTFTNTGTKPATDITVTDYLPADFVISSIEVVNDGTTLTNPTDYTYSTSGTNTLTIESTGDAMDIAAGKILTVTITGNIPCE